MAENFYVEGKRMVKLICVTSENNNKFYNLFEQADGTFKVNYGRVQGTSQTMSYPISQWDKIYREKTRKGYKDVTHLFKETLSGSTGSTGASVQNGNKIVKISNSIIRTFIEKIQAFATKSVKANYSVSQDDVTQDQVDFAQKVLNDISARFITLDDASINTNLLELYSIIPRKMDNVRNYLVRDFDTKDKRTDWISKLIDNEQKTLDVMAGQVELIRKQREMEEESAKEIKVAEVSILDVMGITMEEASVNDIDLIKKMLGPNSHQFRTAFRVTNKKTESAYNKMLGTSDNKKTELFWHGSRNENWFNILQSGLLIRPSGAVYTGSMFGDSVYFADKAQKSIGYSSLSGSYWTRGNSSVGYLALYEVHVGNQKHIYKHDSSCYTLNKARINKEGFDSVFAHGGADLRNNEYMIYDVNQCTVRYIVEIAN
jgi:poly [ADP-ribose] polymerase